MFFVFLDRYKEPDKQHKHWNQTGQTMSNSCAIDLLGSWPFDNIQAGMDIGCKCLRSRETSGAFKVGHEQKENNTDANSDRDSLKTATDTDRRCQQFVCVYTGFFTATYST